MTMDAHDTDVALAARFGAGELSSFAELVAQVALTFADERGPDARPPLIDQIVAGAVASLPGVVAAAVETLDPAGRLAAPVLPDGEVAHRLMEAQNRHGQGPCRDALHDNKQVTVADLSADDRWPLFAADALDAGVQAMICTPMEVSGRGIGVLSLVSDEVDFGDAQEDTGSMARVFAAHAGLALSGARRVRDLNAAMSSRDVIGQAKGILMERFQLTPDVAFAVLVRASSVTNTKLRAVCDTLCETGLLPPGALDRRPTN
jgi:GAF domain-containing protein